MNTHSLLKAMNTKVVFTLSDIARLTNSKGYAGLVLYRLKKRGLIRKVSRNAYTTKDNIYAIASHVAMPSYISFWSASSFLGYTEQVLNSIYVATTRKAKSTSFSGYQIRFIPLKEFYGYRKVNTSDGEIFIVEPEKLLLDCFLRPEAMGNFDEIIKVFEKADISEDKVVEYLQRAKNISLIKRVGYILDSVRGIDLSKNFKLDNNYIMLNLLSTKYKKLNTKWRVRV